MVSEVEVVAAMVCETSHEGVQVSSDTPYMEDAAHGRATSLEN